MRIIRKSRVLRKTDRIASYTKQQLSQMLRVSLQRELDAALHNETSHATGHIPLSTYSSPTLIKASRQSRPGAADTSSPTAKYLPPNPSVSFNS